VQSLRPCATQVSMRSRTATAYLAERRAFRLTLLALILMTAILSLLSYLTPLGVQYWNYKALKHIEGMKIKEPFTFAVFGDNKNSSKVFRGLLKKIASDKEILFAMDLGDLVFDGEKEKFRYFLNQIKGFPKPLLTAIGNHELREGGRALYYRFFGPYYYSFTAGGSCFIVLDDANEVGLEPWEWDWMRQELEKAQRYKYRFVFFHVPLYDPRNPQQGNLESRIVIKLGRKMFAHCLKDKKQADKLAKLFARYHVTHIFASHIHAYYTGRWHGVPFTITGGAGAELVGNNPEHDFYHYLKVHVGNKGVKAELVKLPTPPYHWLIRLPETAWVYLRSFVVIHWLNLILSTLLAGLLIDLYWFLKRRG